MHNPSIPHSWQDKHRSAKKERPRTFAEAVPPMYLFFIFLFPLTLWFPVHRNNMIAVRASGLCLHWLRGFRADIHDTLSAPWAFQSLHSCPPPRIQPRFLAAGALTWRLSHCLPPVRFLLTLPRQESLLPMYLPPLPLLYLYTNTSIFFMEDTAPPISTIPKPSNLSHTDRAANPPSGA